MKYNDGNRIKYNNNVALLNINNKEKNNIRLIFKNTDTIHNSVIELGNYYIFIFSNNIVNI